MATSLNLLLKKQLQYTDKAKKRAKNKK